MSETKYVCKVSDVIGLEGGQTIYEVCIGDGVYVDVKRIEGNPDYYYIMQNEDGVTTAYTSGGKAVDVPYDGFRVLRVVHEFVEKEKEVA